MTTTTSLVPGSLSAIAAQTGKSLAETFISAEVIIITDTSGSMSSADSRDGRTRLDVLISELTQLQNSLPGKIAVVNFSDTVQFEPSGRPTNLNGGTNLVKALHFVKVADAIPGMRFILISDGQPFNPEECLQVAKAFKSKIDVIYVGPEESPTGRDFLTRLSQATGGQTITADRAKELAAGVIALLASGC